MAELKKGNLSMSLKVFYIDDEPDLLDMFYDLFSNTNIHITTFTDPAVALLEIQKNAPDLLFIDYRLPNINGDQIARELSPGLPKFLITGDLNLNCETNFEAIFTKPYQNDDIQKILDKYVALKASQSK